MRFIVWFCFVYPIFKHYNCYYWLDCYILQKYFIQKIEFFVVVVASAKKKTAAHFHVGCVKIHHHNRPHNNSCGIVKFSNLIIELDSMHRVHRFCFQSLFSPLLQLNTILGITHWVYRFFSGLCFIYGFLFGSNQWKLFFSSLSLVMHVLFGVFRHKWIWNSFAE